MAFARRFGWQPAAELAEWNAALPTYRNIAMEISDVWMLGTSLSDARFEINEAASTLLLCTGLLRFGSDPSGDTAFVVTLPGATAPVHAYDHETGELDAGDYPSLANFVAASWGKAKRAKLVKRPPLEDAHVLFERMKWLWMLPSGEPGYRFAADMAHAPRFEAWLVEKQALTPVLANYWLLAHYFLGNDAACTEAIALAAKLPGEATAELAKLVGALLAAPTRATLGKLAPRTLAELRAAARKNADEALLEPTAREAVAQTRSIGTAADPTHLAQRLGEGWALFAEFPDDVAAHDQLLAALANNDPALAHVVEKYRRARESSDVHDVWPGKYDPAKNFDARLAPAIGAAFRAGLAFDAAHARAAPSLVNTLAHLDDDHAMTAFAAAIEACTIDDERLPYVVKAIAASTHARARAIQRRAAWKYFDTLAVTKKSLEKTAAEGLTLDNMHRSHNHLIGAVANAIRTADEDSEKLVDKICASSAQWGVIEPLLSVVFSYVSAKRLERHTDVVAGYLEAIFALERENFSTTLHYTAAEAALAYAKLAPQAAEPMLRKVLAAAGDPLARTRSASKSRQMTLDKLAAALAGLLVLAPDDATVRAWTERILGGRVGWDRSYGPLRGVIEAKLAVARPWILYHLYDTASSNHIGEKANIMRAAARALVALGAAEPPRFDTTDQFASKRPDAELVVALGEPQRHLTDYVFKRIVERELRSAAIVTATEVILRDVYRFSTDDIERHTCAERVEGLKCMIAQGESALPAVSRLLDLPHMAGSDKTVILIVAGAIANIVVVLAELAAASPDELLAMLELDTIEPRHLAHLDILAAYALATLGVRAHVSVEAAIRWRFGLICEGVDHWLPQDAVAIGLARLATRLPDGPTLLAELAVLANYHSRELVKAARAHVPGALDDIPDDLALEVDPDRGARRISIVVAASELVIAYAATDVHCQGIIQNNAFEHAGTIVTTSAEVSRSTARALAKTFALLGFARKAVKLEKSSSSPKKPARGPALKAPPKKG